MRIHIRFSKGASVLAIGFVILLALIIVISVQTSPSRVTIAAWQPDSRSADMVAHSPTEHSSMNGKATLSRSNGLPIRGGSGGSAKEGPRSSYFSRGWSVEDQWWQLSGLTTVGFERVEVSFSTKGSSTGPANFMLEFSVDGTEWLPLATNNGSLIKYSVESDSKFQKHGPFLLFSQVSNLEQLHIRFINTDAQSVGGDTTKSSGTNYIADIVITGVWHPLD